jgi:hypothetical protein
MSLDQVGPCCRNQEDIVYIPGSNQENFAPFSSTGIATVGHRLCFHIEQGLRNFRFPHSRRGTLRTHPTCWPPAARTARESDRRLCRFPETE